MTSLPRVLVSALTLLMLAACQPASSPDVEAAQATEPAPSIAADNSPAADPSAEPAPATAESAKADAPTHPALQVQTLDHGAFDLAAERGQWVVVNFWATWCKPCLKEIPDLSAFDQARDDVRVIGLAYEEITPEDMRAFLTRHPASYPIALLDPYDPPADFETPRGLPLTYLIAPDGRVAKKFLGPVTSADLAQAITDAG
ncbi:redoxin family protein [Arenimonas sp. MALMAid1274]|uniref:TlpA family protein disulfide reductase n=1 Tax=Arenimonas sp. MALMAid1274 TaxID=3411630 RepID=UPI003BA369D2